MSTRSQIKLKNSADNILIYKHWDGYPENVLPVLIPFVHEFMGSRGYDGPYLLAQLVRRFAVVDYIDRQSDVFGGGYEFLGWGLDCVQHEDIEYLYEIGKDGAIYVNGKKMSEEQRFKYLKKAAQYEKA